ncbi:hypothetical protein [Dendronalium phyllosphericum]|uniref:hypothetical protein n=1 Tax=Dendronalium phyllosphericum TaxID=2840445 RepID=UPI00384DB4E2
MYTYPNSPSQSKKETVKRITIELELDKTGEQITVELASDEAKRLDNYCNQTGKVAKDVIRELIQGITLI